MFEQLTVFATLLVALGLFIWGRWRHDLVALLAMLFLATTGILEPHRVFAGFGNEAVISVAAIMVAGRAVEASGLTEPLARWLSRISGSPSGQSLALLSSSASLSAFMNNTGTLAVLLPLSVKLARASRRLASSILMPLAFSSLLGGLITVIGTPPNILVAEIRGEHMGEAYSMFDFTPVGIGIAGVGVLFLAFVGWRLLPARRGLASARGFYRIGQYFAEVVVPVDSPLEGRTLGELEGLEVDINVVGLVREGQRIVVPTVNELLHAGDNLLVEATGEELHKLLRLGQLELGVDRQIAESELGTKEVLLQEVVVAQGSPLEGRTPKGLGLRRRYGVNLLALSRQGERIVRRLRLIRFRVGDVLLVQARSEDWDDTFHELRVLPLQERDLPLLSTPKMLKCFSIFATAIVLLSTGVLPIGVAFTSAAVAMILSGVISLKQAYNAVDWSVIVLLGATLPLGWALEDTGGAETVARFIVDLEYGGPSWLIVGTLLAVTMALSNVINNAACAVIMAPIAYRMAVDLGVNPDTFFMTVAVGASCAFATPIGHQCNLLVLGPGGYRFSDYGRLGIPLSLLVIAVGVPLILLVWPPG